MSTLALAGTFTAAEGQSGALTPFTFTVSRSGDLSQAAEASYFVWHESTTSADIAGNAAGRVVFDPGAASTSLLIYVAGDATVEANEVFHVQLYHPRGATLGENDARGVIVNDDGGVPPQPVSNFQFSTTSVSKAEGTGNPTSFYYTITRTGDVQFGATVFVTVAGSGTNPADASDARLIADDVVRFADGETTKLYQVVVNGDPTAEADETFTVTLKPTPHSSNTTGPNRQAQGTILNDDAPGSGQVINSPGPGSTLQGGSGNDTLNASQGPDVLTGGGGGDAFVYQGLPWNAGRVTDFTLGSDRLDLSKIFQSSGYTGSDPVADGRMRFDSDGSGGTKVYFDRDAPNSGDWPFLITTLEGVSPTGLTWAQLSTGAPGGGGQTQVGFAAGRVEKAEGNSGSTPFEFTILRTGDLSGTTTAEWHVPPPHHYGKGAVAVDNDFFGNAYPSGSVTFVPGETSKVVTVHVLGEGAVEANEAFVLAIRHADGATVGAQGSGLIVNDDVAESPGQVINSPGPGSNLQGGAGADTLNASQGPDQLTGGGGGDHFVFAKPPWNAGLITDFAPGSDKIDVSALLDAYTGSNPMADGWLRLDDAGGSTKVYVDIDGAGGEWPFLITTLRGVPPSSVGLGDFIL